LPAEHEALNDGRTVPLGTDCVQDGAQRHRTSDETYSEMDT
jgi:hypothetical protein